MRQLEGLLVTSVGVMRAVAVQLLRSEVDPRGVHHLRVTVAYSQPSFCACTSSAPSVTVFWWMRALWKDIVESNPVI